MRMTYLLAFAALMLAGCASAPQQDRYCEGFGLKPGDGEYAKCTQYYFQQQAVFDKDLGYCKAEADVTYPPSLYSRPYSYPVRTHSIYGGFGRTEMVHMGADYQQHAALDAKRMEIIAPCMQMRGWNSPVTWQAGRHAENTRPMFQPLPRLVPPLPWQ